MSTPEPVPEPPKPLALIAGIARGAYTRVKSPVCREGWNIRVISSEHEGRHDLKSIWRKVIDFMDGQMDGGDGIHLFLAHDWEEDRPTFRELKERSHRAVWLEKSMYRQYGKPFFEDAFNNLLAFEERWRADVRPTVDSPLLLPETMFQVDRHSADLWSRARKIHESSEDEIGHVLKLVSRFRQSYHQEDCWKDERGRMFRHGPNHAFHTPSWYRWKLTFNIPIGFHFDVRHEKSRGFTLGNGADRRDFNEYTNVDPHGHIRGGH